MPENRTGTVNSIKCIFVDINAIGDALSRFRGMEACGILGGDAMWIILSVGAIVFAALNIIWSVRNREAKWFSYISLSLTALTLCAFYSNEAGRVVNEDWGGLMDVMPAMSKMLWACTVASILINSIVLFKGRK